MEAGQQRSCHDPAGILTLLIAVGSPLEIAERQRATVAMRRSILTGGMVIRERFVVGYEDLGSMGDVRCLEKIFQA